MSTANGISMGDRSFVYSTYDESKKYQYKSIPSDIYFKYEMYRVKTALNCLAHNSMPQTLTTDTQGYYQSEERSESSFEPTALQVSDFENHQPPSTEFSSRNQVSDDISVPLIPLPNTEDMILMQPNSVDIMTTNSGDLVTLSSQPNELAPLIDIDLSYMLEDPVEKSNNVNNEAAAFFDNQTSQPLQKNEQFGDFLAPPTHLVDGDAQLIGSENKSNADISAEDLECEEFPDNESFYSAMDMNFSPTQTGNFSSDPTENIQNSKTRPTTAGSDSINDFFGYNTSQFSIPDETSIEDQTFFSMHNQPNSNNRVRIFSDQQISANRNIEEILEECDDTTIYSDDCEESIEKYVDTFQSEDEIVDNPEDDDEKEQDEYRYEFNDENHVVSSYYRCAKESEDSSFDNISVTSERSTIESLLDGQGEGYISSDSLDRPRLQPQFGPHSSQESILLRPNLYPFGYINCSSTHKQSDLYYGPPVAPIHYHLRGGKIHFQDLGCLLLGFNQFGRPIVGLDDSEYISASMVYAFATMLYECINSPYRDYLSAQIQRGLMTPYEFVCALGRHHIFQDYLRCVQWNELDRIFPAHQYRFVLSTFYHDDTYENIVSMQALEQFLSEM